MKLFLLLAFLFAAPLHAAAILHPRFGFTVAPKDAPQGAAYTWHEAVKVCRAQGMALPSQEEMAVVYCHAKLDEKKISPHFPQADKACRKAGVSATLDNFVEGGRYWTSSRYNDGVMRYVDFRDGEIGYKGKEQRLNVRCVAPRGNSARLPHALPYDINDMDKASFDYIIDTIAGLYEGPLKAKGRELRIKKRWADEEESARSWYMEENLREVGRIRYVREVELIGGLARHPMLNRDAFALVVCHEIGHHFGGAPVALGYSAEGQSDYFATSKCMKRYLKMTKYRQTAHAALPQELEARCAASFRAAADREVCRRNILAALALTRWFAQTREAVPTDLEARDPSRQRATIVHGYPSPQCRLDTMVAGALCPIDPEIAFDDEDPSIGACTRGAGYEREARPRCWFKMEGIAAAATPGGR